MIHKAGQLFVSDSHGAKYREKRNKYTAVEMFLTEKLKARAVLVPCVCCIHLHFLFV